ncbi:MAG: pseudouridine synthase [bacterium]
MTSERIQKLMARTGLGSRRQIESHLSDGEILVNNKKIQPGHKVDEGDIIEYFGQQWKVETQDNEQPTEVLLLNKPIGYITTRSDPEGRKTIFELLPRPSNGRWVSVGRLDINTSGLMILTNNGELANRLMHPSYKMDREYLCRIHGDPTDEDLKRLRTGIQFDDGELKFNDLVEGESSDNNRWFNVVVMEGKNREVRRLWETVDCQVSRLKRVRYGPVFMPPSLRSKRFEFLAPKDIRVLFREVGLKPARGILQMQSIRGKKGTRKSSKNTPWNKPDPKSSRNRRNHKR